MYGVCIVLITTLEQYPNNLINQFSQAIDSFGYNILK